MNYIVLSNTIINKIIFFQFQPILKGFLYMYTDHAFKGFDIIFKKFQQNTLINLSGSLVYIFLRFIFYTLLFYKLDPILYGSMGYFFSYIFLMVNIASAPTLFMPTHIINNQKNVFSLLRSYVLLFFIQSLLLIGTTIFFYNHIQSIPSVHQLLIEYPLLLPLSAALIFLEGLRLLLRFCLHMINKTYIIVPLELVSMVLYIGAVFYYLAFSPYFSLYHIFAPFLVDSMIITALFAYLFTAWLLKIKKNSLSQQHESPQTRTNKQERQLILDSLAHTLSFYAQALLSDNMIIVSFMPTLGLAQIALPKFAAYLAESFKILIKALVKFSVLPAFAQITLQKDFLNSTNDKRTNEYKYFFLYAQYYFFLILALSIALITAILIYCYLQTTPLSWLSNSLFLVLAFLIIKGIDQWNFFYEKIILSQEKPISIICISTTKILIATFLFYFQTSLIQTIITLASIKAIVACFLSWYTNRRLF